MLIPFNNSYHVSQSPHSIGLQNNMTIPVAWADNNWFVINQHRWNTMGMQGLGEISQGEGYGMVSHHGPCGCGCSGGCKGMGSISDILSFDSFTSTFGDWSAFDWVMFLGITLGIAYVFGGGIGSGSRKSSGRRIRRYSAKRKRWEEAEA